MRPLVASTTFTGNGTNTIGTRMRGKIIAVKVVADASVTASFDLTLTGTVYGIPILIDLTTTADATTWYYPKQLVTDGADGSAATDAYAEIPLYNESITCVTANAGTTGKITVTVFFDSES